MNEYTILIKASTGVERKYFAKAATEAEAIKQAKAHTKLTDRKGRYTFTYTVVA